FPLCKLLSVCVFSCDKTCKLALSSSMSCLMDSRLCGEHLSQVSSGILRIRTSVISSLLLPCCILCRFPIAVSSPSPKRLSSCTPCRNTSSSRIVSRIRNPHVLISFSPISSRNKRNIFPVSFCLFITVAILGFSAGKVGEIPVLYILCPFMFVCPVWIISSHSTSLFSSEYQFSILEITP